MADNMIRITCPSCSYTEPLLAYVTVNRPEGKELLWCKQCDKLYTESGVYVGERGRDMADEKKEAITVWKDGSWRAHSKGDAYYAAQGDPEWLVNIDLADVESFDEREKAFIEKEGDAEKGLV